MNKSFTFNRLSLDVFANGKAILESNKVNLHEIRIGVDLQDELLHIPETSFIESLLDDTERPYEFKIFGADVVLPVDKDVYYMRPDEILFLSVFDHIYVRGNSAKEYCMFCGRAAGKGLVIDGPQGSPLEPVCEVCYRKAVF